MRRSSLDLVVDHFVVVGFLFGDGVGHFLPHFCERSFLAVLDLLVLLLGSLKDNPRVARLWVERIRGL